MVRESLQPTQEREEASSGAERRDKAVWQPDGGDISDPDLIRGLQGGLLEQIRIALVGWRASFVVTNCRLS